MRSEDKMTREEYEALKKKISTYDDDKKKIAEFEEAERKKLEDARKKLELERKSESESKKSYPRVLTIAYRPAEEKKATLVGTRDLDQGEVIVGVANALGNYLAKETEIPAERLTADILSAVMMSIATHTLFDAIGGIINAK